MRVIRFIAIVAVAVLAGQVKVHAQGFVDLPLAVSPDGKRLVPIQASKALRYAWSPLGETKTIALGEALKALPNSHVVIWCPGSDCTELQADLDDAFQIAGWTSDFDRRRVDSNDDVGLFVGPPSDQARDLAKAITKATGIKTEVVEAPVHASNTLDVFIGKRPREEIPK